jgi:hypothetical protein
MLKKEDYAILSKIVGEETTNKGIANHIYWHAYIKSYDLRKSKKTNPDLFTALGRNKDILPTLINHKEDYIRVIVSWRFKHNK